MILRMRVICARHWQRRGLLWRVWNTDAGDGRPRLKIVKAGYAAATSGKGALVMGHSAGGHLALLLSAAASMRGVVALAPVACLRLGYEENLGSGAVADFMNGKPGEIPAEYAAADPALHASTVGRVLIYGTNDDVVSVANGRAYVDERRGDAGVVKLVEVEGADHFDLIDPASRAWAIVLANVKQFLG